MLCASMQEARTAVREGLAARLMLPEVDVRVLQLNTLAAWQPSTPTGLPGGQAGAASPLPVLAPSPSAEAATAPASPASWPGLLALAWAPGPATSQTGIASTAPGSGLPGAQPGGRHLLVQHQPPPFQGGRQLHQQAAGTGPASRWWNLTVLVTPQLAGRLQLMPFTAASAAALLQQPGAGTEVARTGDTLDDASRVAGCCQPQALSAASVHVWHDA